MVLPKRKGILGLDSLGMIPELSRWRVVVTLHHFPWGKGMPTKTVLNVADLDNKIFQLQRRILELELLVLPHPPYLPPVTPEEARRNLIELAEALGGMTKSDKELMEEIDRRG